MCYFNSYKTIQKYKSIVPERSDTTILNKKKLGKFVSGINESPGLYGEISDYWRNTEDDEFNDRSESIAFLEQDDAMVTILNNLLEKRVFQLQLTHYSIYKI